MSCTLISFSAKYVTGQSKMLVKTMGASKEIIGLIKLSPKYENILGCIKKQLQFDSEYKTLSNTIDCQWKVFTKDNFRWL